VDFILYNNKNLGLRMENMVLKNGYYKNIIDIRRIYKNNNLELVTGFDEFESFKAFYK
jgi:hypothetical protein